jgi:hypothetical protein
VDFKQKFNHLYTKYHETFSDAYKDNEVITATFHKEDNLGISDETRIDRTLDSGIKEKFRDLNVHRGHSLKFTIRKDGEGNVLNYEDFNSFVASIVLYQVLFNAFVFVGDKDTGCTLFASQRKIYNNDYLVSLYDGGIPSYYRLGTRGEEIYDTMHSQWNLKEGRPVFNLEDCWPIYLLNDAKDLISVFKLGFGVDIMKLE